MIFNPRKNSAVSFPRIWRGFGQENPTESTARNPLPFAAPTEPARHLFRERISSISGT